MGNAAELSVRFEKERPRLVAIAARLLVSLTVAEDAVQETWLRLERADAGDIRNLEGWLTTVVSRICLDELSPRADAMSDLGASSSGQMSRSPSWVIQREAVMADQVGLALLIVLDRLSAAERVAFVLFDVLQCPYADIDRALDRTPDATRQLVSRARVKVRRAARGSDRDRADQRAVTKAWLRAVEHGDLHAIVEVLADDAVLTADWGTRLDRIAGAAAIAEQAKHSARLAANSVLVRIDGQPGVAAVMRGRVVSLMAFDIAEGRITRLDVLADMKRLESEGVLGVVLAKADT